MSDKSKVTIRSATAMDSVNIVRLIKAGYTETPAKDIGELDEHQLLEYVVATIRAGFTLVADMEGRLLGTIAMAPIRMPWFPTPIMAEVWLAVVPNYRPKGVPEQLIGVVEQLLDRQNMAGFLGTQMLTPAELDSAYAKRPGYRASRASFIRLPRPALAQKKAVGQ